VSGERVGEGERGLLRPWSSWQTVLSDPATTVPVMGTRQAPERGPEKRASRLAELGLVQMHPIADRNRWVCRCLTCGETVEIHWSRLSARRRGQIGCRKCSYKTRNRDLALSQDRAREVALAAGFEPLEPYTSNHTPWRCQCQMCGTVGKPRLANLRIRKSGCETCARVIRGAKRRLPLDEAVEIMRTAGVEPDPDAYPGVDKPWPGTCKTCGSPTTACVTNARRLGRGCRTCASFGLPWDAPARLYLLWHPRWLAFKLGIAALHPVCESRTAFLSRRYGWEPWFSVSTSNGMVAFRTEQAVLAWIRHDLLLPVHLTGDLTQGHTETFSADLLPGSAIWQRVLSELEAQEGADGAHGMIARSGDA
jgi:hypothetical protein